MSDPPQYEFTTPLQSGSATLLQPQARRRLCLSELDVNIPLNRRACSLQHSLPSEDLEPQKFTSNVTDERRSALLPPPVTKARRRYVSAQSENEHPLSSYEEPPINELDRCLRPYSRAFRQPAQRKRYPSFVFDGPGDRRSDSIPANGYSEDVGTSNEALISPSLDSGHGIGQEPQVEIIHLEESRLPRFIEGVATSAAPPAEPSDAVHLDEPDHAVSRTEVFLPLRSPRKRHDFTAGASSDRFIHARRPGLEMRDSFVLSRPTSGLNQWQRMLRRRTGLTDPLGPSPGSSAVVGPNVENVQQRPVANPHAPTQLTLRPDLDARPNMFHQLGLPARRTPSTFGTPRTRTVSGRGNDGQGRLLSSGSTARYYAPKFLDKRLPIEDTDLYEKRLALALDLDLSTKVLGSSSSSSPSSPRTPSTLASSLHSPKMKLGPAEAPSRTIWQDNEWRREGLIALRKNPKKKLLKADGLRDDFYCSILAYSYRADCLAVGLGSKAYLWNEERGLIHLPPQLDVHPPVHRPAYITSLAFSSEAGGKAILALGRVDGRLMLWSPLDTEPRFMPLTMPHSAAHLSFRPQTIRRQSQRHESMIADNEVLLVGDDYGNVWVFLVEWPKEQDRFLYGWDGGLALIAKIDVHVQQICGIAWSSDGDYFSTGGNDNLCCLFQANVLFGSLPSEVASTMSIRRDTSGQQFISLGPNGVPQVLLGQEHVRHSWRLTAAVKAMAFCPWQRGLLAAGGGSNDRCIHFYHTMSGACLATIDCAAQVTSLVWSSNRREIAATLGFPQPEHPYRIVVYSWPSCEQVVAIPWHDEMRALYAIPYPGGPNEKRRHGQGPDAWRYRTGDEECMVVAGSDGSIKFHEIWSKDRTAVGPGKGLLGGSDILESLHGIEKEFGETIR